MCKINRKETFKRTPIKIIISIFLIFGVLLSDILLKTIVKYHNIDLIHTVRIIDFVFISIAVMILLIAENKERDND